MQEFEAQNWAREYMRCLGYSENSVQKLKVIYRKKTSNLGMCYIKRRLIILNERFCTNRSNDTVLGLIAHEVAHLKARKHNKRFRDVLGSINKDALTVFQNRNINDVERKIERAMCMFEESV